MENERNLFLNIHSSVKQAIKMRPEKEVGLDPSSF